MKIRCLQRSASISIRALSLALAFLLAGCAVNPVTGRQELVLVTESMEIGMGQENYAPARQMQGGDYVADPSIAAYVREVGGRLAAVSDRRLPYEFTVLNDSVPNAWAMPGGKIAINRGLLLMLENEAELAAVLGHEIVHAAARHSAKSMERALLLQGAVMAAAAAVDSAKHGDDLTGALVVGGAQVAAVLLEQRYSRDAETEADLYGMRYMVRAGYNPQSAVTLQEKFVALAKGEKMGILERLFSSHPPSTDRVNANLALLKGLPEGGETGRDRYMMRIAHLIMTRPAYESYDKGMEALKKGDARNALELARSAAAIEPREALFYILEGEALERLGKEQDALKAYDGAINLNPDHYLPYELKGLLFYRMGWLKPARYALEKSSAFLETAPATHALGRIALSEGRYNEARRYFKAALQSDSSIGRNAWVDLLRLDLPELAGEYLDAGLGLDKNGRLFIKVYNKTPVELKGIVAALRTPKGDVRITIPGAVAGNGSYIYNTGAGPVDKEGLKNFSVRIISARLAVDH